MNINTLGLCKKAGRLVCGFDPVLEELAKPKTKAAGILLAKDLSPKTRKELDFRLRQAGKNIPCRELDADMDSIGRILGKRTGILLITDEGFWRNLTNNSAQSV